MIHQEINTENAIKIDSVSEFISNIKQLKEASEGSSTELYFRGQETEFWNIEPSIFRDDMLSIENKLMQIPLQKNPTEFKDLNCMFDIMTKYQHYGMCTRLLDLTTNPLVALYFACKHHGDETYLIDGVKKNREPYGVVYFTNYYPSQSTDKAVRIVSALASYDLQKENTIKAVLNNLVNDKIIDEKSKSRWLDKSHLHEFIEMLQQNYMVIPTYSNDRLQKQSGVFLLASMFSVDINENIEDGVITKCKRKLREEFNETFFYVDNKEEILKELDLYNINEATLFPELEHQLNYIRYANKSYTTPVSDFIKYEEDTKKTSIFPDINDEELNEFVLKGLKEKLSLMREIDNTSDILKIIEDNLVVDWYRRNNTSSRMMMDIATYLMNATPEKDKTKAKVLSQKIMSILNDETKKYISS